MFRYPVILKAEKDDIKEIEFNKSRLIICFKDGTVAEYVYSFLKSRGRLKFDNQ